jgi:asparagine synthase (glutamine-hydrolysing)
MREFLGFYSCAPRRPLLPRTRQRVWPDDELYISDDWPQREVRVFSAPSGPAHVSGERKRVTFLGLVFASDDEIARALDHPMDGRWHERLLHFPGSYSVVLQQGQELWASTDVVGLRSIFYTQRDGGWLYSSSSSTLQQEVGCKIDPGWLALHLICAPIPDAIAARSPFKAVRSVPPGHWLQITRGSCSCLPYWTPPEPNQPIQVTASMLRKALVDGIKRRVAYGVKLSSDLSGGLDSTSLSLLAAKELSATNSQLTTITMRDRATDDFLYAERALTAADNIRPTIIDVEDFAPAYSGLGDRVHADEPTPTACSPTRLRELAEIVRGFRSDVHLSGGGGDSVLHGNIAFLIDLAQTRKFRQLLRDSRAWSPSSHQPALWTAWEA